MAYVDTVTTLPLTRNRGGRPVTEATKERRAAAARIQPAEDGDEAAKRRLPGVQLGPGQQGGARLAKQGGRWGWRFAVDQHKGVPQIRLRSETPVKTLLPHLRVIQPPTEVDTTSSLEYLRLMCSKYEHLGLDELVGPELAAAADDSTISEVYLGEGLQVVHHPHAKVASSLVLYKSGELGNELGVAVFAPKSNTIIQRRPLSRFIATSLPLERFPTEILQIAISIALSPNQLGSRGTGIAIRLHSTTHFFSLIPIQTYAGSPDAAPVSIAHIGSLPSASTGCRRHMDIALHPTEWGKVTVVDDQGGVWLWEVGKEDPRDMDVTAIRAPTTTQRGSFFRVSWSTETGYILVISHREVVSIDVDGSSYPTTTLLQLPSPSKLVGIDHTAAEREANITCLLSDEEIIWLDASRPGQSTLRWRHAMGHMRGLRLMVYPQAAHDCYILYSQTSPTITLFHISSDTPIRLLSPPYTLSLPVSTNPSADIALIDLQRNTDQASDIRLLVSYTDGSLSAIPLGSGDVVEDEPTEPKLKAKLSTIWGESMQDLAEEGPVEGLPEDGLEKRPTERTLYDARWAWEAINADLTEEGSSISATGLARYLRELDAPSEHFMTGAELARDAVLTGKEEENPLRTHGLRQLRLAAFDPEALTALDDVDLTNDLVPVLEADIAASHVDGRPNGTVSTVREVHSLLKSYCMDPEKVGPILQNACKRDAQDAATLAVDLALSTRILSSEPLPTAKPIDAEAARPALTPEDVLQRAAKLTLDEEGPPKVSLHYLPEAAVLDDEEGLPRPDIQIPTIRHLLSEWAPSADPKDYAWKSWVDPPDGDRPLEQTSTQTRPIRPLPSPRGSPRPSQYAAPVFAPTASRTLGIPSLYQPRAYTQASQPVPYSLPAPTRQKGVPVVMSHTQRLASPRPSPPPSPIPGPGRAANVSPTIRRQAARSPEALTGSLATPAQGWAATQVERGPFGGRPTGTGEKKKKPKKRLGGF